MGFLICESGALNGILVCLELIRQQCYLNQAIAEVVTLHVDHDLKPYALDYFVSPIPGDGSCPRSKTKVATPAEAMKTFSVGARYLNTTVLQRIAGTPPL